MPLTTTKLTDGNALTNRLKQHRQKDCAHFQQYLYTRTFVSTWSNLKIKIIHMVVYPWQADCREYVKSRTRFYLNKEKRHVLLNTRILLRSFCKHMWISFRCSLTHRTAHQYASPCCGRRLSACLNTIFECKACGHCAVIAVISNLSLSAV